MPLIRPGFALFAFVMILVAGVAGGQWLEDGAFAENSPWAKGNGIHGAVLMITDDPNGLFESWNRGAWSRQGPEVVETAVAARGDLVMGYVVLSGCAADAHGNCNASVAYTVYYPHGAIYGNHIGEAWADKPAPQPGHLLLSIANLGLHFDDDDPVGEYTIEAVITDHVAETELDLLQRITVVD